MFDIIFYSCFSSAQSASPTTLLAVFSCRSSFYITKMRDRDNNIFFFNEIFYLHFIIQISNFRFSFITEFFFYFHQFFAYQCKSFCFIPSKSFR